MTGSRRFGTPLRRQFPSGGIDLLDRSCRKRALTGGAVLEKAHWPRGFRRRAPPQMALQMARRASRSNTTKPLEMLTSASRRQAGSQSAQFLLRALEIGDVGPQEDEAAFGGRLAVQQHPPAVLELHFARQVVIQHDDVGNVGLDYGSELFTIGGERDVVALLGQTLGKEVADRGFRRRPRRRGLCRPLLNACSTIGSTLHRRAVQSARGGATTKSAFRRFRRCRTAPTVPRGR